MLFLALLTVRSLVSFAARASWHAAMYFFPRHRDVEPTSVALRHAASCPKEDTRGVASQLLKLRCRLLRAHP